MPTRSNPSPARAATTSSAMSGTREPARVGLVLTSVGDIARSSRSIARERAKRSERHVRAATSRRSRLQARECRPRWSARRDAERPARAERGAVRSHEPEIREQRDTDGDGDAGVDRLRRRDVPTAPTGVAVAERRGTARGTRWSPRQRPVRRRGARRRRRRARPRAADRRPTRAGRRTRPRSSRRAPRA